MAGVNAIAVLDPVSDKIVAQIPTGASPRIAGFFRGVSAGTAVVQGPGELQLLPSPGAMTTAHRTVLSITTAPKGP
ncbi:MAG TPA: hypothetical protein VGK44_00570, partial [Casimicrobiaceae bacterium]